MPNFDCAAPERQQSSETNYCPSYNAILIELKDTVILTSVEDVQLPKYTMKSIAYCAATMEYQCGRSTQEQYFDRLTCDFNLPRQEVEASMLAMRRSMRIIDALVQELAAIKAENQYPIRFFAVANLSHEDYAQAVSLGLARTLFDQILLSSDLGMQKPELRFYRQVLSMIGVSAEEAILVDSDPDNVLAALSLGLQHASSCQDPFSLRLEKLTGVVICHQDTHFKQRARSDSAFLDQDSVRRCVYSATKAVLEGTKFLQNNAKAFFSHTSTGVRIDDNFTELIILELTGDHTLVDLEIPPNTWNFFKGIPVLTQANHPDDVDTTALGLTVLDQSLDIANLVMDKMLQYLSPDGILQTYFTDYKNRVDPTECCNALSLFHHYGRGHQLATTLDWVRQVLKRGAYIRGSAFYPIPESFLFFLSRLLPRLEDSRPDVYREVKEMLKERIKERIGLEADAPGLAMRLLVCERANVRDVQGLKNLMAIQEIDGGWEAGQLFAYASKNLRVGNRGVSTALAVEANSRCRSWLTPLDCH